MTPTLDRNEFDLATNELVVTFGYINEYQDQVVPLGGANFFIPGPINKGQPTYYLFGTHHNVFTIRHSTAQFDTLSWTLGIGNVVAKKSEATAYVDTDASFTQTSDAHTFPIYHGKANSSYTLTGGSFAAANSASLDAGALLHVNGGSFSTATLTTNATSTVRVTDSTLSVTDEFTNAGTIELRGGTFAVASLTNQSGATLDVQSGSHSSIDSLTNLGTLKGSGGSLSYGAFTNGGAVNWQAGTLSLTSLDNDGTFTLADGTVSIAGDLTNSGSLRITGGTLNVTNITPGGFLDWTGGTIQLTDSGLTTDGSSFLGANPTLGPGQTLELSGATTITAGKFVTITSTATLDTNGGSNSGTFFVTGGTLKSERGTFTNNSGATLYATAATLTFAGDGLKNGDGLQNYGTLTLVDTIVNGDVHSAAGSSVAIAGSVTFNGLVSGAGNFTGSGLAVFNGGYSPGDSPALVTVAGDLTFGSTNDLFMEIGGLGRGTDYDALVVSGLLTFGGELIIEFLGDFTANLGDSFDLFDWGTSTGDFSSLDLPELGEGLTWDVSQIYTTGTLSVTAIPEPSTYAAFAGVAALGWVIVRRRKPAA